MYNYIYTPSLIYNFDLTVNSWRKVHKCLLLKSFLDVSSIKT